MPAGPDDWRKMGQERDLPPGTLLVLKRYRAPSERWEHDHCLFCFAKFMDPESSEGHRQFIEQHAEALTEGYTTTAAHQRGAECVWVCPRCFDDFHEELAWREGP